MIWAKVAGRTPRRLSPRSSSRRRSYPRIWINPDYRGKELTDHVAYAATKIHVLRSAKPVATRVEREYQWQAAAEVGITAWQPPCTRGSSPKKRPVRGRPTGPTFGCSGHGATPKALARFLPPQKPSRRTLPLKRGLTRPSTLGRRLAAIRYAHRLAGLPLPTDAEGVKATMRCVRRTYGSAKVRKAPAVAARMLGMVATDGAAGLSAAFAGLCGGVSPLGAGCPRRGRSRGDRMRPVRDDPA